MIWANMKFKTLSNILIFSVFAAAFWGINIPKALAFDFGLNIASDSGRVGLNETLKTAINITSSSDDHWYSVTLFPSITPKGVKINFSPSSCTPPCSSIMTITTTKDAEQRNYPISISATGKGVTRNANYNLSITPLEGVLTAPLLISPVNSYISSNLTPFLSWSKVNGAEIYEITVGSITKQTNSPYFNIPLGMLSYNTKYDWRVRACNVSQADCSTWSDTWSFTTSQNQQATIESLKAQIAAIQKAILLLQEQLVKLKAGK
jgi:hypothetical protein